MLGPWSTDPTAWAAVGGLLVAHLVGVARLWRVPAGRRFVPTWRVGVGTAGVLVLLLALLSPLDDVAQRRTWVHMLQHLVLLLAVAPALVVGRVAATLGAAAPRPMRELPRWRAGSATTRPVLAAVLLGLVWWVWHVPALYAVAVRLPAVHALEHATMLGAGWLLWTVLVDDRRRSAGAARLLAALGTALHMAAMAAMLTFPGETWLVTPGRPAGVDAHLDQMLAGGLLWFPGGVAWVVTGAVLVWRWVRDDEAGVVVR